MEHVPSAINAVSPLDKPRRSADFLTFKDIEEQYPNTAKAGTLFIWKCSRRYGFDKLVTNVGRKVVVRRDRWEAFLESRTACNSDLAVA